MDGDFINVEWEYIINSSSFFDFSHNNIYKMNQSLEIDLKEITFSKYFNRNNNSLFTSNDLLDTTISTPTKY